ncbi:MAG: hypothetical protein IJN29_02110 [Akkermansia sp.]|nr:hypothetical protein [Akkermansia sp.]
MRASNYKDSLAAQVLFFIQSGQSLRQACSQAKIAKSTFMRWIDSRPMLQMAYDLAKRGRDDRRRGEIAEINKEIKRLEATIPKVCERGEPGFIFRSRRRYARKDVMPKITALRMRRDVLKWELGRMTARARLWWNDCAAAPQNGGKRTVNV